VKPEQLEYAAPGPGQCILHVFPRGTSDLYDRIFVERADPAVAISEALIRQIRAGDAHPDVRLDGDVLVIDAANQRVSYRLGKCGQPGYLLGTLI
jgi:hypothetical protein